MEKSKTSNRYSAEVRSRAVRMVLEHGADHASQWAAIGSIAAKIGCTGETLRGWVRQAVSISLARLSPDRATEIDVMPAGDSPADGADAGPDGCANEGCAPRQGGDGGATAGADQGAGRCPIATVVAASGQGERQADNETQLCAWLVHRSSSSSERRNSK